MGLALNLLLLGVSFAPAIIGKLSQGGQKTITQGIKDSKLGQRARGLFYATNAKGEVVNRAKAGYAALQAAKTAGQKGTWNKAVGAFTSGVKLLRGPAAVVAGGVAALGALAYWLTRSKNKATVQVSNASGGLIPANAASASAIKSMRPGLVSGLSADELVLLHCAALLRDRGYKATPAKLTRLVQDLDIEGADLTNLKLATSPLVNILGATATSCAGAAAAASTLVGSRPLDKKAIAENLQKLVKEKKITANDAKILAQSAINNKTMGDASAVAYRRAAANSMAIAKLVADSTVAANDIIRTIKLVSKVL